MKKLKHFKSKLVFFLKWRIIYELLTPEQRSMMICALIDHDKYSLIHYADCMEETFEEFRNHSHINPR